MEASFDNCEQHIYRESNDNNNLFYAPPDRGLRSISCSKINIVFKVDGMANREYLSQSKYQSGVGKLEFKSAIEFKLVQPSWSLAVNRR
jgi:hypothetical protein